MTNNEIIKAAQILLNVCDGARSQDGTGYNGFDAPFMHNILLLDKYTHKQVVVIHKILKKYSKQLELHGINYDDLKLNRCDMDENYRHVKIDPSWNNFLINFGKFKGKSIGQIFKEEPSYVHWLAEESFIDSVKDAAKDVLAGKPIKIQKPNDGKVYITAKGGLIFIKTSFEMKNKIKTLSQRQWNGMMWQCPVSIIEEVVEKFKNDEVEMTREFKIELNRIKNLKLKSNKTTSNLQLNNFGNGKELMTFQKAGVEFVEETGLNALIADEMGLGKTCQSLACLQLHTDLRPTLIVCPASLKLNWEKEIRMWLESDESVEILKGKKTHFLTASITIINYDIVKAWENEILKYSPKLMICDESHMLKSQKTIRTKIIKNLSLNIPHKILLTGTPVLNRPNELWQQLNIIDPITYDKFTTFAFRYCDPYHNGFGWNFKGESNIDELVNNLKSIMIRRTKDQVLKELPPKRRTLVPVEINNKKEYIKIKKNFKKWYYENQGKSTYMEQLIQLEYLKQTAAKGKIKASIEWINNFLETGKKLVVFATHHQVINTLMVKYSDIAVKIDGTVPNEQRQENVDKFQNDPNIKLFIGNIQAAGIGLTLTAASDVAFLELGWTPALHDQAEDRVHRIGQDNGVNIYYLLAKDTIDEQIMNLLEEKREIVDKMMSNDKNLKFNLFDELF